MKIFVKVHSKSGKEEIKKINEENYEVWLKSEAKENKANIELLKLLSKYFKREVKIMKGLTSRNKIIMLKE
jgi:uncharacterized protein